MAAAERFLDCVKRARADITEHDSNGPDSKSDLTLLGMLGRVLLAIGRRIGRA
jgi:hypothetical protein